MSLTSLTIPKQKSSAPEIFRAPRHLAVASAMTNSKGTSTSKRLQQWPSDDQMHRKYVFNDFHTNHQDAICIIQP
jgi:hypothetical protein